MITFKSFLYDVGYAVVIAIMAAFISIVASTLLEFGSRLYYVIILTVPVLFGCAFIIARASYQKFKKSVELHITAIACFLLIQMVLGGFITSIPPTTEEVAYTQLQKNIFAMEPSWLLIFSLTLVNMLLTADLKDQERLCN